ncbi:MAG: DUF3500 domain-containing protein [Verrucomicrobiota bacterium]|nr:DUF3500 domain-containing protein [Verrucomicrobiota bacterium]
MKSVRLLAVVAAFFIANPSFADVASDMARSANALLASLDKEQISLATFKFNGEERTYWHFIPAEMLKGGHRKGLQIKQMTKEQRQLTHALLKTVLSESGHTKVKNIMFLEDILFVLEGKNRRFVRDSEAYHILIFGKPSNKGTWGWRFEGHHVSLNYTIIDGKLSVVPSFWASNPAVADFGPGRRLIALEVEEFAARKLRNSLSTEQANKAVIADKAPRDILTSALPKVKALENAGIAYGELNKDQQTQLTKLIKEYINRHRAVVAKEDWGKIEKGGLDKIRFSWAGSTKAFEPHYYRVQGPTFLLEYANTQNGANHIHATWRDFNGDFGRDLLREHVKKAH